MSIRKAAVVSISSFLGSVQNVTKTYENFSAVPYRVSKVSATRLTGVKHLFKAPCCFLPSHLSFCCIWSVRAEHADHVRRGGAQEGRDPVFFAAPWMGAHRHGRTEREWPVFIAKQSGSEVHPTTTMWHVCVQLFLLSTLHLVRILTWI